MFNRISKDIYHRFFSIDSKLFQYARVLFLVICVILCNVKYAMSLESQKHVQNEQDMIKDNFQTTLHKPEKQEFAKSAIPNYLESRFLALPLFYIQAGIGVTSTREMTKAYPPVRNGVIPLFAASLGYNQQFQFQDFSFGFKLQFGGDIGFQSIDNAPLGTNTETYYGANAYAIRYIGWQNILLYGGIGYEIMSATTYDIQPVCTTTDGVTECTDTTTEHNFILQGISFIGGIAITLSKHHAIDISMRYSGIYNFPKFLLNYEFRY